MSESSELSRAIVEAIRFVGKVHEQVGALAQTLEREMHRRGWASMDTSDIGAGLSNRLRNPAAWMPRLITRVYAPKDGPKEVMLVFVAVLESDEIEHATFLTAALRMMVPVSPKMLFDSWKESDSLEGVLPLIADREEVWMDLPDEAREDPKLWSRPEIARVRAVDLVLISNERELNSRVIEPALAEATRIGAVPPGK